MTAYTPGTESGGGNSNIPYVQDLVFDDGVTDNQPVLQAAVNAAHTAGGGTVYLPYSTHALGLAGQLSIPQGVVLKGAGVWQWKNPPNPYTAGAAQGTMICGSTATGAGYPNGALIALNSNTATLETLTVYGGPITNAAGTTPQMALGVWSNANGTRVRGCQLLNSTTNYFSTAGSSDCNVEFSSSQNAASPGIITQTVTTGGSNLTTVTMNSIAGIVPGMVCINISKLNNNVITYVLSASAGTVTLSAAVNPNTGNTLAFIGGCNIAVLGPDNMHVGVRGLTGCTVDGAGDWQQVNCHWSEPHATVTSFTESTTLTPGSNTGTSLVVSAGAPAMSQGLPITIYDNAGTPNCFHVQVTTAYSGGAGTVAITSTPVPAWFNGGVATSGFTSIYAPGYNYIKKTTAGGSMVVNTTIDNGSGTSSGHIWRIQGPLRVGLSRMQNGSSATGNQSMPVVMDQGVDTTFGTIFSGDLPEVNGQFSTLINYLAAANNPQDQIVGPLTIATGAVQTKVANTPAVTLAGTPGIQRAVYYNGVLQPSIGVTSGVVQLAANSGTLSAGSANEITGLATGAIPPGTYLFTVAVDISGPTSTGHIDVYLAPSASSGAVVSSAVQGTTLRFTTGVDLSATFSALVTITTGGSMSPYVFPISGMTGTIIAVAANQAGAAAFKISSVAWEMVA